MANDEMDKDSKDLADKANNAYVEGKKDVKDAWADTKAEAEKASNEIEAESEKE